MKMSSLILRGSWGNCISWICLDIDIIIATIIIIVIVIVVSERSIIHVERIGIIENSIFSTPYIALFDT